MARPRSGVSARATEAPTPARTVMLGELSNLLDATPGEATREDYADAVLEDNCLGKRTAATRKLSLQRLTELYGLDAKLILFRVLRDLWGRHEPSRPLLGLLLALARDPLLRTIAAAVIRTPFGHEFARQTMKDALSDAVGDRLNKATLDKVVRNASSSWTQSGHLQGRGRKTRQRVLTDPRRNNIRIAVGICGGPSWPNAVRDTLDRHPGMSVLTNSSTLPAMPGGWG